MVREDVHDLKDICRKCVGSHYCIDKTITKAGWSAITAGTQYIADWDWQTKLRNANINGNVADLVDARPKYMVWAVFESDAVLPRSATVNWIPRTIPSSGNEPSLTGFVQYASRDGEYAKGWFTLDDNTANYPCGYETASYTTEHFYFETIRGTPWASFPYD